MVGGCEFCSSVPETLAAVFSPNISLGTGSATSSSPLRQVPPHLGVRFATESMHYTKMRIRDTEFLLPLDSEMTAEDELGTYSLNMIRLERCREFTGQTVVTFGGAVEGGSADRQDPNP